MPFSRFAAAIALLLTALFAALAAPAARAEPADITAAARSVVRVVLISEEDGELSIVGHGSGIAVAPGLILTNAHVVRPAQESDTIRIGIVPPEGKSGGFGKVEVVSPGNDLALVRMEGRFSLPIATLFVGAVGDGADVFAIGYPGSVDLAQGYNMGDLVSPTAPVKTRGNISAGRASRQFDTLLHTAPIGTGNSGGPLLDACGRVIGINSFGTISESGDSEFYFAVSMREVTRFLLNARVKAQISGEPCRSIADVDRSEAERLAGEKALSDEAARTLAVKNETARRAAQLDIIARRENGMALAGVALLLAIVAGGAAFFFLQKDNRRNAALCGVLGMALLAGSVAAWLNRPSLADIDSQTDGEPDGTSSDAASAASTELSGDLVCVLDSARSRVTVSDASDIDLNWRTDGCADGRDQFGRVAESWSRVVVPDNEETVTVSSFDPAGGILRADRYLLGLEDMTRLRAARQKIPAAACGRGADAARDLGTLQGELRALLPSTPNERLLYRCQKAK